MCYGKKVKPTQQTEIISCKTVRANDYTTQLNQETVLKEQIKEKKKEKKRKIKRKKEQNQKAHNVGF